MGFHTPRIPMICAYNFFFLCVSDRYSYIHIKSFKHRVVVVDVVVIMYI